MLQFSRLKELNPEAGVEQLWHLVNQAELTLKRGGKNQEVLPEKPLDAEILKPGGRQHVQGEIPLEVSKPAVTTLVDQRGAGPLRPRGWLSWQPGSTPGVAPE